MTYQQGIDDLLARVTVHDLDVILLEPNGKGPYAPHGSWIVTRDESVIRRHHGNWGITAKSVTIVDIDDTGALIKLLESERLAPPRPTVITASGKMHFYFQACRELPAKLMWGNQRIGEIQRHEGQYVVCPPSSIKGKSYDWQIDPGEPFPDFPEDWREYLCAQQLPERLQGKRSDLLGVPGDDWIGPPPEELIRRALEQPGARRRADGVKFQCPACLAEGHDKHMDNAKVFNNGRWGCAKYPGDEIHKRAIGFVLIPPPKLPDREREPMTIPEGDWL